MPVACLQEGIAGEYSFEWNNHPPTHVVIDHANIYLARHMIGRLKNFQKASRVYVSSQKNLPYVMCLYTYLASKDAFFFPIYRFAVISSPLLSYLSS